MRTQARRPLQAPSQIRATESLPLVVAIPACFVLSALGGFAMLLAFPGYDIWIASYLGMAVLMWMVLNLPGPLAFVGTELWSICFFIPLISWTRVSTNSFAPWLALAIIQVLWMGLWAIAAIGARRRWGTGAPALYCILLVLGFAGIEQARAHFPWHGFAWGMLGYSQVDSPLAALIPILGEVGMSILVALIGLLLALLVATISRWWMRLVALAAVVLIFLSSGLALAKFDWQQPTQGQLNVRAVQGNISTNYMSDLRKRYVVLTNHVQATEDAGPGADLVVWGEQSADIDPRSDGTAAALISRAVQTAQAPVIIGTVPVFERKYRTNDMVVVRPDGQYAASYSKQRPVPFGEYIPAREFFSHLTSDVNQVPIDMRPGTAPAVLPIDLADGRHLKLAVGICFEVAVDNIMRQGIAAGGQLLVIPTNNASFGFSDESVQQMQMVRFRALEYHRSAVSASLNGVSALIEPNGNILRRTELFQREAISSPLALHTDFTPAYYAQPYLPWTVMGIALLWLLWGMFGVRRDVLKI